MIPSPVTLVGLQQIHMKIDRYSENYSVDGVERRWKIFWNIFEKCKIFWKFNYIWAVERYFTIIGFMVVRGGGKYFEMYLKIARFFENWKIFWKLFGWWCWEGVEGSTQENLDGSWSGARHKTNFQTFVHQIINHVHKFIHFSCCKHSVIETNYASYLHLQI